MDPVSIFELTCTVLELSQKLYKFFNAIRDAPEEIRGYLSALEAIRRVFVDIQEYVEMYQLSAFVMEDGVRLRVIELALNDCEQEFALQLSFIEDSRPENASSFFAKAKKKVQWVFKKEIIEGLTRKLEKLQSLLSLAVATSTGKNDVLLQRRLEVVSLEVHHVSKMQEVEAAERQDFLLKLQQYATQIQSGISFFLQLAQESNIRSDARLGDLTDSLSADVCISTEGDFRQENGATQGHGSLVQDYGDKDTEGGIHAVAKQPGARHGSSSAQEARPSSPDLQLVSQVPPPMSQAPAESLGCRPIIEKAFARYKESLSEDDEDLVKGRVHTWEDVQTQLPYKPSQKVTRIALKLVGIRSQAMADQSLGSGARTAIVWSAMRLMHNKHSLIPRSFAIECLTEISDAVQTCERELVLYKDSKLRNLVARLYKLLLETLQPFHGSYLLSDSRFHHQMPDGLFFQEDLEKPLAEVRKLSQAVLREVDYQHRLELRETSSRIMDMQIEQRKILTTLEDQKRILRSLQEERRIISVVQEQQKILQIVQQIQATMQARGMSEQTRS